MIVSRLLSWVTCARALQASNQNLPDQRNGQRAIGPRRVRRSTARGLGILKVAILAIISAVAADSAKAADGDGATPTFHGSLKQIQETGRFVAGTRSDSPPFAFPDDAGHPKGFAVDILEQVRANLERTLQRPVAMEIIFITPKNRFQKIADNEILIECGVTGPTWSRQENVDFSTPFFINGARILTRRSVAKNLHDLAGKRIAVTKGGTEQRAVEDNVVKPEIAEVSDITTGMAMLESGEVDGLSNINGILRSLLNSSKNKGALTLLPRDGALIYEPLSCMVQKNDTDLRSLVDRTIANLLKDAENYKGKYIDIYNRWFGPGSDMPIPLDLEVIERMQRASFWLD